MKYKVLIILCMLVMAMCMSARGKQKVLYITGHTDRYHSWQVLSKYQVALLKETGIFTVDELLLPDTVTTERVDFSDYDVVVLNVNQVIWSDSMKRRFAKYVRRGGGLVIVHEANNAFPEWKEFNRMIALGGWGDRNEQAGPFCYWRNGQMVKDFSTSGSAGKHGKKVPFIINIRNGSHPIVEGLPAQWLHVNDELYGNLRGPADNMDVIATAFSDEKSGGTGKEEPVLFTVSYGKGRVFHCVLGHTSKGSDKALRNVGYQIVFQRGTEWAASGQVTIPLVGISLSVDKPSLREIE